MLRASVRDLKSLDLPVHVIFSNLDHYDSGPNVIDRIRNVWSAQYNKDVYFLPWVVNMERCCARSNTKKESLTNQP